MHTWLGKALKSTVVNKALLSLHRSSLEFSLTVPLGKCFRYLDGNQGLRNSRETTSGKKIQTYHYQAQRSDTSEHLGA